VDHDREPVEVILDDVLQRCIRSVPKIEETVMNATRARPSCGKVATYSIGGAVSRCIRIGSQRLCRLIHDGKQHTAC
jgi:hypothetical protein